MKPILQMLLVVGGGIFVWGSSATAQSSLTPDEYNTLVTAVEGTTPQPASEAPLFGNFYTITHGESWPPLPADTMGLNYWPLGGNFYLLDDRAFDYSASRAEFSYGAPFPTNGASGGGEWSEPEFSPQFTSNDLYLTNLVVISNVASLKIHPPPGVTNGSWDLLYRTNPLPPDSWRFVLHTLPGQTNLTVSNAVGPEGFYALGKADSSQGTNFWLAFPTMAFDGNGNLSLYITSPIGAAGTVTVYGESNGPTLTVTGTNDDPGIYGTYSLTNAYLDPSTYFQFGIFPLTGAPVSNIYARGSFRIFFDESRGDNYGWVLADSSSSSVLYEGPYGANNLNDVAWASLNNAFAVLTTSCAEGQLLLPFSVAAGSVATVPIPDDAMINFDNVKGTNNAINVLANTPVSVYAFDYDPTLSAMFTAYPTGLLGTNYCVLARASQTVAFMGSNFFSEIAIVATVDGTAVTITPSANANLDGFSGTTTNIALDRGQAFELRSIGYTNDVTGTTVVSDKPIAVFAGANNAKVPDASTGAPNPIMQQQIPVEDWGTNFLSVSFAGRTNGDTYRILAAENSTVLFVTGNILISTNESSSPYTVATSNETVSFTVNTGQFLDVGVEGPAEFRASKPISVAHFANGTIFDALEGDPLDLIVPPTGHYLETNIVIAPVGDFDENFLNVIVPGAATNSTFIDATLIPVASYTNIGASGYFSAQVPTSSGPHVVSSPQPVGVEAHGFGVTDSYSYSAGIVK